MVVDFRQTAERGKEKENTGLTVVIVLRPVAVLFDVPNGDHSTSARGYAPMSQRCSIPALASSEGAS